MLSKFLDKIVDRIVYHLDERLLEKYPQYRKLKNKEEKLERALTTARKIQRAIIPQIQPKFEGYDLHTRIKPYYLVGGDYYDYMHINEKKLGLAIADVSGKGLEASLITHSIHAALDILARSDNLDLSNKLSILNNYLQKHTPEDKFATLIYGELNQEEFKYCNAGHESPLVYSKNGITLIKNHNPVLGFVKDVKYNIHSLKLEIGDILLLYSDGVTDSIGKKGVKLMGDTLMKHHSKKSSFISNKIYEVLDRYEQIDDQTTFIIKRIS